MFKLNSIKASAVKPTVPETEFSIGTIPSTTSSLSTASKTSQTVFLKLSSAFLSLFKAASWENVPSGPNVAIFIFSLF